MRCRGLFPILIAGLFAVTTTVHAQKTFEQGLDAYLKGDYAKALELWEPAAESGDPVAAFNIGVLYAQGLGVEADPDESVRWYRQSALAGYSNAQFNLGAAYYNGEGTELNVGQAIAWWEKAAQQDHPEALYNLATLYRRGEGTQQNLKRATELFEKAVNLGDSRAQQALEVLRSEEPQADGGTVAEAEPASTGQAAPDEQQTTIAREDPDRWTVQVFASVEREAAERFAEERGLTDQLRIYKAEIDGKTWYKGIYGSYPNQEAAQAAKAELEKKLPGSGPWARRLGVVQKEAVEEVTRARAAPAPETETGTEPSRAATPLEEVAGETEQAESGEASENEPAASAAGESAQPASVPETKQQKTAAVSRSSREAGLRKGQRAFNVQNYGEAFEAWRPLAEAGVPEAQYGIGFMYESGWGVEKSFEEAFRWYQLAAQQGHVKAQFNLGMLYRNGQGVSQNDALGLYWIQTAADRGDERAIGYLKTLN